MNLPNKLTLVRILMVPAAAIIYLAVPADWAPVVPSIGLGGRDLIVFAIFAIASFTDFLDGNIARSRDLITSFGKFADPIADKLLVNTLLILLAWSHQASVAAVLLMTARDLIVDGLRMSAAKSGEVVSAGWWGKVKTVLQMGTIILYYFASFFAPPDAIGTVTLVTQALCWAVAAVTVLSGFIYIKDNASVLLD